MEYIRTQLIRNRIGLVAIAVGLMVATIGSAADIEPSSLSTSKARSFLGEWVLTAELGDEKTMVFSVNFVDVGGKLGATLQTAAAAKPTVVTDIVESSTALKLRYMAQQGETEMPMSLILRLGSAGMISGTLEDAMNSGGEEGRGALGLGLFAAPVHGQKGGKVPGRALLRLGEDMVRITYGSVRTAAADYASFKEIENGEVVQFTRSRATKLFTDIDLAFGDALIAAENSGPNYPGVYSLWLKKVDGGWNLIFNSEPDIWGTMRNPEKDIAEIPLSYSRLDKEESKFTIDLEDEAQGGVLRVAWGKNEWKTPFRIAQ